MTRKPRTKRTELRTSLAVAERDLAVANARRDYFEVDAATLRIEQLTLGLQELEAREAKAVARSSEAEYEDAAE
jgi:hypothetical protein